MKPEDFNMSGVYSEEPKPIDFYLKLEDQPDGSVKLIAVDSTGQKLRSGDLISVKFNSERNRWYLWLHSGVNDELPFLFDNDHTLYTRQEHKSERPPRSSHSSSDDGPNMADLTLSGMI